MNWNALPVTFFRQYAALWLLLLYPAFSWANNPGYDYIPPTAVCDDLVHVSLNGSGQAIVYAGTFDEGSNDNSCFAGVKVRRKDEPYAPFGPFVIFDCDDVGQIIEVELKAYDCSGNTSVCWSSALIEDKIAPYISCPYPTTVNCDETEDWGVVGMPTATDNCSLASLDFTETDNTGSCGTGLRTRTWVATDHSGNSSSCVQQIYVVDNTPVYIDFPPDYTTYDCTSVNDLHPDSLPAPFDRPKVIGADCELIATSYEDWVFTAASPSCIKVIRKWNVIDWCSYDYGGDQGYWSDTQILKIQDTIPPSFTCPDDVVVSTDYGGCDATFTLPQPTDIEDCLPNVEVDIITELGEGPVYNDIAIGEYTAKYVLKDGCNNTSKCEINVSVVDAAPPTAACLNGVSLSLMVSGMAEIWASDLEVSSYDFCTPYEDLEFRIGPAPAPGQTDPPAEDVLFFDCDDLGLNTIALWVGDQAGNWSYCLTYAIVQDNQGVCGEADPDGAYAYLSGFTHDEQGHGIAETQVWIDSTNYMYMTDTAGHYKFNSMQMYETYTLRPQRQGDDMEGVDMSDLMMLAKHLSGQDTLDSPYQIIAADVDGSGYLNEQDLLMLHFLILGMEYDIPDSLNWQFIPADFEFPIANPLAVNYPQHITVHDLLLDQDSLDFIGVKRGDLNASAFDGPANATAAGALEDRAVAWLWAEGRTVPAEATVSVPVYADENSGLQGALLQMEYPGLILEEIEEAAAQLITYQSTAAHEATLSWVSGVPVDAATPLFYLHFRAKERVQLQEVLSLRPGSLLATNQGAQWVPGVMQFREQVAEAGQVRLFPNPFRDELRIRFDLPATQQVSLRIWNANGQLVYEHEEQAAGGFNDWQLPGHQLGEAGTYLYRIAAKNLQHNGKIVRIP